MLTFLSRSISLVSAVMAVALLALTPTLAAADECMDILVECRDSIDVDPNIDACAFCRTAEVCSRAFDACNCTQVVPLPIVDDPEHYDPANDPEYQEALHDCIKANAYDCSEECGTTTTEPSPPAPEPPPSTTG